MKQLSLILITNIIAALFIFGQCSPPTVQPGQAVEGDSQLELDRSEGVTIPAVITPTLIPEEESESMPQEADYEQRGLAPLIQIAKADLANRLTMPMDEVEVLVVEEVTWSDSSMGCPQPGMMYAQVLQDGLLIKLAAGDQTYEYHSGGTREPFLCEKRVTLNKEAPPKIDLLAPKPDQTDK